MSVISNTATVSVTVIVSESDPQRELPESLAITGTPIPADASGKIREPPPPKPKAKPLVIRSAATVLTGQSDFLESIAPCFVSENAKLKKLGEKWVLESLEFTRCTSAEQLFLVADDLVSRIHSILALYINSTPSLAAKYVYWTDGEGHPWRVIRGSSGFDIISSKGLAELRKASGTQPLASAVFQAISQDSTVREALKLHGESKLGWSQIYDIVEFLGGVDEIVKAKFASKNKTRIVRQTANHHRHLGSTRGFPLPSNPPSLAEGQDFARGLLKLWIASRL
jgi:hypothetical protein